MPTYANFPTAKSLILRGSNEYRHFRKPLLYPSELQPRDRQFTTAEDSALNCTWLYPNLYPASPIYAEFCVHIASAGRFDVLHEREKTLGKCGVDIDGALQKCVRLIRKHEGAEDLHEFAAFGCQDGSSEDAIVGCINHNFHEPRGFTALDGSRHTSH